MVVVGDRTYLDFDLAFERQGDAYRLRVLASPAGEAEASFVSPFGDLEIENFVLKVGRTRKGVRRVDSPEMQTAKAFGDRLYKSVFSGAVEGRLLGALTAAESQNKGLRIRLHLSKVPELADIPWEFLYRADFNRFLSLSEATPVVRYLSLAEAVRPVGVQAPLRVLVVIASPLDHPQLDVEREWAKLHDAVADVEKRGLIALERLANPTLLGLQHQLRKTEYHVFHFVGHGTFDPKTQEGFLAFENEQRLGHLVPAQHLSTLLFDERSLQLAVLNACEGGRTGRTDVFAGTAQALVQQAVPAVIAMQFEITDEAAITLAHQFYAALADGYPVDAALAEARKAIYTTAAGGVEWGTPVLYMRATDGHIFDVHAPPEGGDPKQLAGSLLHEADEAMSEGRWESAANWLDRLLRVEPAHQEAVARLRLAREEQEVQERLASAREHLRAGRLAEAAGELSWLKTRRPGDANVAAMDQSLTEKNREIEQARQRSVRIGALHQEAEAAFARGDWAGCIEKLQSLLQLDNEDAEAHALLQRAQQQRQLMTPFERGREHYMAGRWRQALSELRSVRDRGGTYEGLGLMIDTAAVELNRPRQRPSVWSRFKFLSVGGCLGGLAVLGALTALLLAVASQECGSSTTAPLVMPPTLAPFPTPAPGHASFCVTPQVSCPLVQPLPIGMSCVCFTAFGQVPGTAR